MDRQAESGLWAPLPLFAYGSLMSGNEHHDRLLGDAVERVELAMAWNLALVTVGAFPLAVLDHDNGLALGQIIWLRSDFTAEGRRAVMQRCDAWEGLDPSDVEGDAPYARQRILARTLRHPHDDIECWAWISMGSLEDFSEQDRVLGWWRPADVRMEAP